MASTPIPIPISRVRWGEEAAHRLLQEFIFGGRYAGRQAPRGIDPPVVSDFIREKLTPTSPDHAYMRAAIAMRFYERADVLDHIRLALTGKETAAEDVSRSCYALQMYGDLGTPEMVAQAANYFDTYLVPHPEAGQLFALLMETVATLAPAARVDKLRLRMMEEMQKASQVEDLAGPKGARYRTLGDLLRNNLPRAVNTLQARSRLLATPVVQRRTELIYIYMGESDFSDPEMEVFAGRLIRRDAMESDPNPIYADFARVLEAADPKRMEPGRADFLAQRAAQAILYLQGKLSRAHRIRMEGVKRESMNFLWDELVMPNEAKQEQE